MEAQRPTHDRRSVLRGGLGLGALALGATAGGAAVLSSCGDGSGPTVSEGVSAGPDASLQPLFPRDVPYLAAGIPSRLVYTVIDPEGVPLTEIESPLDFTVRFDGEVVDEPVNVEPHSDGVPRPYLPLYFSFPRAGLYDIESSYQGQKLVSQVQVFDPQRVEQPLVGSALPSANTPTTVQSFNVDPICTRVPQCPFHAVDLAEALGTGRPVVVLLASPAYCRTTSCGPTLDLLVELAADREDLIVIHSEVYKNPKDVKDLNDAALAPLPAEFKMTFEPSLFVTDASNTLVVRGDIVVDRTEMAQMLDMATA